jgi:hypothetical protein
MKVEVISFMYNEEFLLPFFLEHYSWADKINVIFDQDSNDNTLRLLESNSKVRIIPFKFPDMMDDALKVKKINEVYKDLKSCDRILLVDADEFIFIDKNQLEKLRYPIVNVKLFNVYRHVSESNLDINKPIREQRSHGTFDKMYNKPIIARTGLNVAWDIGNHSVDKLDLISSINRQFSKKVLKQTFFRGHDCRVIGAHWANADSCFCVDRRVKHRRDRQSKFNLSHKITLHQHNITEQSVLDECKMHENDPEVLNRFVN